MFLSSVGVSALDKGTSNLLKEEKFTGWFYDRNIKNWNYVRNGEAVKNDWIDDNGHKYYLKEDGSMWYNHKNRIRNGVQISPYRWIDKS